ncbi:unnamed protein product [Fusarium fujikuroi]|uniref:Uncharacterized protein n=1 Tax=Fusarium fujikuroi TaxID=5127 RepID=A0A9Q9RZ85_FUSFU|nr:uncharacterized protein FFE2_10988 [Fusarium fujikuroi]VTT74091.1 unnamed protein product [Fusarium fujikuroi]VTT81284.1 unnamed protein product [Fusarium fujikuroi]VZH94189.1 unnamed protein product [Fusarium fujikuroi]
MNPARGDPENRSLFSYYSRILSGREILLEDTLQNSLDSNTAVLLLFSDIQVILIINGGMGVVIGKIQ